MDTLLENLFLSEMHLCCKEGYPANKWAIRTQRVLTLYNLGCQGFQEWILFAYQYLQGQLSLAK